ncbi:uncharacterized protein LOC105889409 [Clupea harengus]|uniref:Uncharacterized protein LOC105889409 n=1 Tax=Clupea harengus TaxID=7950 RepID=A0A6P8EIL8_CLUHA|nr:uncharacterized protein LOC105889409 [Clupea harengus]
MEYRMTRSPLGLCVIINNEHSHRSQSRKGSDADTDALRKVFTWLDFSVQCHKDLTTEEMKSVLLGCSQKADGDCFVCCVLSRWENGGVFGCDNVFLPIKDMLALFEVNNCPALSRKPKLFFIQACQENAGDIGTDISKEGVPGSDIATTVQKEFTMSAEADFLLSVATVDMFHSFRHPAAGSWFIQSLCSQLREGRLGQRDICTILNELSGLLAKPVLQRFNFLTKRLVFPIHKPGISGGERYCQNYRPTRCCKSCSHITDTSHWALMEPSVSIETEVPVYKHRSPPGSFECTVSGLRWVCAGEVTLQYHFSDPYEFRAEVAMLQYTPISSLMDIKVLSGELLEAHLPHFACLDGADSSLSDAVRVLRGADTGITLETCELTRFHAKLLKPSFSLTEVLVKIGIPLKTHLEVLIYRTRVTPLVLFTYVVPWNASMMQSVKDDLRQERVKKIERPQPDTSLWIDSKYNLRTSCHSEITPDKYTLNYERANFFEVYIKEPEECFDLELISGGQSIWKTPLQRVDYGETQDVTPGGVKREVNYTSKAATPSLDEGRMASLPYRERLFLFRPHVIKRISGSVHRVLLDGLQDHQPPVLSGREAEEVLQSTSVLQDQVTSLIDIVHKKGEKACGIMLVLLKEKDIYLYEDILLELQASLLEHGS